MPSVYSAPLVVSLESYVDLLSTTLLPTTLSVAYHHVTYRPL